MGFDVKLEVQNIIINFSKKMSGRRALHFVFKVGNRNSMMGFLKNTLGMTVLRHEEFEQGCEATCNGPYDGKWSKTMIGYGPEDSHFVLEITYNYPIDKYQLGNDFLGVTIGAPSDRMAEIKSIGDWKEENGQLFTKSPAGYKFFLEKDDVLHIKQVALSTANLETSLQFWKDILGMKVLSKDDKHALLTYEETKQASLRLVSTPNGEAVDHATAFGRIAFALPTPDKADVQVIILEDPDKNEICFVGEEGFSDLSQVDPNAVELLQKAMEADKSNEWYEKKKKSKDA